MKRFGLPFAAGFLVAAVLGGAMRLLPGEEKKPEVPPNANRFLIFGDEREHQGKKQIWLRTGRAYDGQWVDLVEKDCTPHQGRMTFSQDEVLVLHECGNVTLEKTADAANDD